MTELMFSVFFFQFLVIGSLVLCVLGVAVLIGFLWIDLRDKQIW
ncbi:hypothetical protein RISK_001132 [Rhodopirellula islandica]|uniref:Uncharacterized protein n=1 Tax=Rhodopirellula islandica TaxID=595434 RepID=A0A0J1BK70_RHOIS|nr:hypothetical protein [Rhodopirellula islandica]KLU06818.1 hypothetical protein RISK_001132 [Rhodopirellula islandica]